LGLAALLPLLLPLLLQEQQKLKGRQMLLPLRLQPPQHSATVALPTGMLVGPQLIAQEAGQANLAANG
jgi:hypothetical protein